MEANCSFFISSSFPLSLHALSAETCLIMFETIEETTRQIENRYFIIEEALIIHSTEHLCGLFMR